MARAFASKNEDIAAQERSVLLVEDEVMVLALLQEALEDAGYSVMAADRRDEALQLLEKHQMDALITDVRLRRGTDGWDIARRARELDPDIAVVYITGFGSDWPKEGVPESMLLAKPFMPSRVVEAVTELLDR